MDLVLEVEDPSHLVLKLFCGGKKFTIWKGLAKTTRIKGYTVVQCDYTHFARSATDYSFK